MAYVKYIMQTGNHKKIQEIYENRTNTQIKKLLHIAGGSACADTTGNVIQSTYRNARDTKQSDAEWAKEAAEMEIAHAQIQLWSEYLPMRHPGSNK